ncbi:DUF6415 family natural product biosynthesis protein [Streptomyces pharetrae]|uniref:DUF6415 family natural product biosynthesis protein n=1 Tax=Streptomyces pharetrae TaxID=291370 RepID=UPI00345FD5E1
MGHDGVRPFNQDFRAFLRRMIPQVEQLAECPARGRRSTQVALAGVRETRRRLLAPGKAELTTKSCAMTGPFRSRPVRPSRRTHRRRPRPSAMSRRGHLIRRVCGSR